MENWNDYCSYYIEKLRSRERDDGFHGLIEADHSVVPILIDAYRKEKDPVMRCQLVHIIWHHRQQMTIPFLAEALSDLKPDVWREALNGLVALACPESIQVLEAAVSRARATGKDPNDFCLWVAEAIEQARSALEPPAP